MGKVSVVLPDSEKAHSYEGDFEASLTPGGQLLILENVPNVTGKGEPTTKEAKVIYNKSKWDMVLIA